VEYIENACAFCETAQESGYCSSLEQVDQKKSPMDIIENSAAKAATKQTRRGPAVRDLLIELMGRP
jgi:hypothetical protein